MKEEKGEQEVDKKESKGEQEVEEGKQGRAGSDKAERKKGKKRREDEKGKNHSSNVKVEVYPILQLHGPGIASRLQSHCHREDAKGQNWPLCVRELGKWRLDSQGHWRLGPGTFPSLGWTLKRPQGLLLLLPCPVLQDRKIRPRVSPGTNCKCLALPLHCHQEQKARCSL